MRWSERDIRAMLRLYAVTDRRWTGAQSLEEQVERAIRGGVTCVQLREKELDCGAFYEAAVRMRALCSRYGTALIINDNVEIALACGADGVHVGQSDMAVEEIRKRVGEHLIIGVTAKTVGQALKAQAAGADYLGSGAVFGTQTKANVIPMPRERLTQIVQAVHIPVVAIGGIGRANVAQLEGTGIAGAAIAAGIFAAQDIEGECAFLRAACDKIAQR